MSAGPLCALDDLDDPGSRAYRVGEGPDALKFFLVRQSKNIFAYINSCPHLGVRLDYTPGRVLNYDKSLIHCSLHGAQFRIEDGKCLFGPCVGDALDPLNIIVRDGQIWLDEPGLGEAVLEG